jgi:energy-coupling factor transporter transmembrane protein EcfT
MEYNYTREFKQKHKMYTIFGWPIPFAEDGLTLESIVVFCIIVGFFIILAFIAFLKKISFLKMIFSSAYLIILFFIGVFVWFVFSLTWDNKPIYQYVLGRVGYLKSSRLQTEHEHKTVLLDQPIHYKQKGGQLCAIKKYKNKSSDFSSHSSGT